MDRLLIVSNRLPVSVRTSGREFTMIPSVGGLATGLRSFYRSFDSRWIGWSGIPSEEASGLDGLEESLKGEACIPVEMPERLLKDYYYGFSNRTIWPLFHYFQHFAEYHWELWEAYKEANRRFAQVVLDTAEPGDRIWIHDYHLMLLPGMLKEELPDSSIGFFLHIPFPSFELFRLLPWREEIMDGILGSDLVGFHSYDYARHFLSSVLRLKGHDRKLNHLDVQGRRVCVDVFPIGIDFEKFNGAPERPGIVKKMKELRAQMGDRKLILSVDRLDYTKGIIHRLEAFEDFLKRNPSYRDRVRLVLLVVPSRTKVPQYKALKLELDRMVGRINSEYSDVTGGPIAYIFKSLPFDELAALYAEADVGLVTPIRDGMNLVAKEYVACQSRKPGMLILSEMAGAVMELSEAIVVNPNNTPSVAEAILEALEMSDEEKTRRMGIMQNRLQRYEVKRWAKDFVEGLYDIRKQQEADAGLDLAEERMACLLEEFSNASNSLLLVNYDGTLVPSGGDLELEKPDETLLSVLRQLRDSSGTRLVIFSGRKRESMETLFGLEEFEMVAEGGFWIKEHGDRWRMIAPLSDYWKEEVRPLMEFYEDRTPGAFLEEKDFSLLWHSRKTEPELARVRTRSLLLSLYAQTANMDLDVMKGKMLVEVRNSDVSKGRAAMHWLDMERWDFIMAAGDDITDESVFNSLPERAWTIKVGAGHTEARSRLVGHEDLRELLRSMNMIRKQEREK